MLSSKSQNGGNTWKLSTENANSRVRKPFWGFEEMWYLDQNKEIQLQNAEETEKSNYSVLQRPRPSDMSKKISNLRKKL